MWSVPVLVLAALLSACASAPIGTERERCDRYEPLVVGAAREFGVEASLIAAITSLESGWNPAAESRAGARGLMQIMPSTGRRLRCGDLYSARDNLRCGARLLKRLLDRYDGRVDFALSAYAMGARVPDRAFRQGKPAPRQRFIRRVEVARRQWVERGCAP